MNVGDYVRTLDGISRVVECRSNRFVNEDGNVYFNNDMMCNSSPNIIDLIKKKDIVIDYKGNIYQVVKVWKGYVFTNKKNGYGQVITLVDYQIKSIVTKEQFSRMEYKI